MGTAALYIVIIVIASLVVAAVILTLAASGKRKRKLSDPYIEALQLMIDHEDDKAFEKLQEAVKIRNAPTDAYLRLGRLLRDRGEASKALQLHQSLTVKNNLSKQEKAALYMNLADDYDRLGKPEKAIRILEEAAKLMSVKESAFYSALVKHYNHLNRIDKAYENLKELKRLHKVDDRKLALFLVTWAEKLMQKGNSKEAAKILQKALKHDANCAPALLMYGNIASMNNDLDGAIERWKRAAIVSPELSGKALANLEKSLFEKGKFGDIERIYTQILENRASDERATIGLALFYKKQGRIDESISLLKEFLSWHVDSTAASLLLISMYAKQGDTVSLDKQTSDSLARFTQVKTYVCEVCRFQSDLMRWHCPVCNSFDSFSSHHEN